MKKILFVLFPLALAACNEGGKGGIVHPLPDSTAVMKYKGGTITAKEINENPQVKAQFAQFEEQALETYKQGAQSVLLERLLKDEAAKQGVASPEALLQKMAAEPVVVSDDEAKAFIKARDLEKGIMDPRTGKKRKVTVEEIKAFLSNTQQREKQKNFLQGLLGQAEAMVVLEEPRVKIPSSGTGPSFGPANAKVVIQEFSDFQCPYCGKAKPTVTEIKKAYGDKIRFEFRHFPIDGHDNALPAAVAANCAHRQGKFWEMHDKFFDNQAALSKEDIVKTAKEIGLDMGKFQPCFDKQETLAEIQKDQQVAGEIGVNSTPTFFVNGKKMAGAMPFEQFKMVIESELRGGK